MTPKKHTKLIKIKSALPLYGAAAAFLLCALILPIYKLWAILVSALVACAGYFGLEKLFPGRTEEITEEIFTGDKELDARIKQGREILLRFRQTAEKSGDESVSAQINRIADATDAIIEEVARDTGDKADTFTFFSYYLPTLDKLFEFYTGFALSGSGENALSSRKRIEGCLEMVAQAFEKFQDKLYKNEAVAIKASVDVLKTMLRADGLASKPDIDTIAEQLSATSNRQ